MNTKTLQMYRMETESKTQINITSPSITINGAMPESLMDQHNDVIAAVEVLRKAIAAAAPHGRDFQTTNSATYEQARVEFHRELDHLNEIEMRHRTISSVIYDQMVDKF